jgi:hypothetical protein
MVAPEIANYEHIYLAQVDDPTAPTTAKPISSDISGANDVSISFTSPAVTQSTQFTLNGAPLWGTYVARVDSTPGGEPNFTDNTILVKDASDVLYILSDTPLTVNTFYSLSDENFVYCLLSGTEVITARGSVSVEELVRGDLVLSENGSFSPVRWVGVQTLSPVFSGKTSWPVKISKDSLGENTPDKDLYVSQDHAIFLHGVLICAEALVNGTTVTLEKPTQSSITYYGLDLGPATIHPVHNLPVGSLGATEREHFDNYQEWLDSGHELIDEPLMYPRVNNASQLPAQLREEISA